MWLVTCCGRSRTPATTRTRLEPLRPAWQMAHLLDAIRDDNGEVAHLAPHGLDELVGIRTIAIREQGQ
jgi:hypothetical protein